MAHAPAVCTDCGRSHLPKFRQLAIRLMVDMPPLEIIEAWPCFYDDGEGPGGAGYARVIRDKRAVKARIRRELAQRAARRQAAA